MEGLPLGDGKTDVAALEAESRLLHAVFDRLPALIAYWDNDLHNVIANDAYVEWFGFTPAQMRGMHIRHVLGEAVFAKNLPFIEGALAGEEQLFDRTLVDTYGRTRHTQASYVPDVVDGEVRGFFVLVTDVTPRVEAQRAMNEAQSLAKLGSWSLILATGEVTWSEELFRIFGLDPLDTTLTPDSMVTPVHPDDLERVRAVRDRAWATGEEYSLEYRIRRPDGTVREVQSRGRPVRGDSGNVVRMTGTLQDVTEANEAAREMARVNTELLQVNQLNADVIGMLGHDVRAPLSVILGYLEELEDSWSTTSEEERRDHVATVHRAAVRLRSLVDDILALATVDAGTIVPRSELVDLGDLVRQAVDELPTRSGITLALGGDSVLVRCDGFHLRQVVANLVSNALRHGAPPVTVSVTADQASATVTVADEGPGVPEDFVPRLFERFARGSDKLKAGSTGFGLYIAARLAQVNQGSLRYEPGPDGRGAHFILTLPRA